MSFAEPRILLFLVLIPLLVVAFVVSERRRRGMIEAMAGDGEGMVMGAGFERRLIFLVFLCLGVGLLVVAAARPQWGAKLETFTSRGIDILVAIDVSDSMLAEDVTPSRMAKAKQEVENFLSLVEGDRVGLIAFAGSAYTFTPLTVDYSAIRLFLSGLQPGAVSDAGTDVGAAVREAVRTFERSQSSAAKVLVVFSDGEHHESDPLDAVQEAVAAGIQIFTVGIGNASTVGERIPLPTEDGEEPIYKLDQAGNLVISKLDEVTLRGVAEAGGGNYYRVSESGLELVEIYKRLRDKEEAEFSSRRQQQREDRYQIPLLIAAIFLLIAYSLGDRSFKALRRTQGVTP